ncbi:MAG TPA: FtsK/SpoIIIE domain-containing protein [Acidimicrobiales bacterium]|nr:FtsK/SpoIIIE domain-containing protein [Acidimicrobiales bacterium]
MQILFTVSGHGPPTDFWLDADPGAPLASLAETVEPDGSRPWWDGRRPLRLDAPIGEELLEGMELTHSPPPAAGLHQVTPVVDLLAVSGPHAGEVWPLPAGEHLIGRSDEASVNLVRDLKVSRRHAVISVHGGGVRIRDEGSAHGTEVECDPVTEVELAEGAYARLGSTVLAWRPHDRPHSPVIRNGEGGLIFNRPPRLLPLAPTATVRFPGPPPVQSGVNFPLMATIAPLVLGVILALVLNPLYLLFTLLSPVMGVSNYLSQRRSGVKSHRARVKAHQAAVARATDELAAALETETAARRAGAPDPATLALVTDGPRPTLWERGRSDDDFMSLRVGLCDRRASVVVEGRESGAGEAGAEPPVVRQVPAVVDLARDGVLGVAGDRRTAESLVTGLLLQAAVLHSPEDLAVTILTGPHQRDAWAWARWLPHLRDRDGRVVARIASTDASVARLAAELSARVDERLGRNRPADSDRVPGHLLIVDGAYQLGALPAVTKVLRLGPEAGIMSICLDDGERLLPEECRAVAVLDGPGPARLRLSTGRGSRTADVLADLVDSGTAERVARRLAPMRLNRRTVAGAAIPSGVRLLQHLSLDPPSPDAIATRWGAEGRSTAAAVGACETGTMVLDLAKDGPHGLVAGTTGSGKSEFLQTLIASLAVSNRPDQMSFVLVDYKGGSAFKECERLPHTVGMVTDLDGHLTERALASIGAELRRRETVLARSGAKDLEAYWRSAGPSDPLLGRLVIVIDEFASLVEELPDFVDGLVDLARRGRSLGIHLILATQRPSGVVSAAIKTNTNLRIAMRVTDAADSVDVIDSPLASRIAKSSPGRAYARVGHEELTEFQAARIGGRRPRLGGPAVRVRPVGWADLGEAVAAPAGERAQEDEDTTDLAVLVDAVREAAEQAGIAAPRRPWLPPLPASFTVDPSALQPPAAGQPPAPALFGLQDLPDQQAQAYASWHPATDGHLLAIGDPGSGRSTLLRTMAAGLASRNSAADVHIYGIDCGNGALIPLETFPHVGAVVTRREPDRVDRLITKLLAETTERQQLLARSGFATIADQRRLSAPEERLPYIVVLLDRWEGFNAEFDALDGGRLVNSLMHLMREGPGAGVRVVVTADRSGTAPRFSSLAERILMLRLNDRTAYAVVGLNPRHLPDAIGPGRAFAAREGTEIQVGLLDDDPSGPSQIAALERLAAVASRRDAGLAEERRPDPIAVLPVHVPLGRVLEQVKDTGRGRGPIVVAGVGGDRLAPLEVDLGRSGPGFLISGPPRSGRSNALMAMAISTLRRGGRVIGVTSRPSPLSSLEGPRGVAGVLDGTRASAADLMDMVNAGGATGLTILVDDAELLADAPVSETLTAFLRSARDFRAGVVVAGTSGELNQFRGFIPEARKSRAGLLLCPPSPAEGDVLNVRLPRTAVFSGPPGRGLLVSEGEITVVQVPFAELEG